MIIKLTVDRVEEGIAVLFDMDGKEYKLFDSYTEGTVLQCEISSDGSVTVLEVLDRETEEKKMKNASRLKALFSRGDYEK